MHIIEKCEAASFRMRRQILEMTYHAISTGAHIGGSLSMVEIMSVLYLGVLRYDATDLKNPVRDRFILSKGHGAMCMYAAMNQAGILTEEELATFKTDDAVFSGHPSMNRDRMIEFSSGSLGQGLSLGVGVCLGLKRAHNEIPRVYVLLGDGECNEGSVWEAAMAASHYKLDNLIAVIDKNQLQYDGETEAVMDMDPMAEKWRAFGWDVIQVDGHDVKALYDAFQQEREKPLAVIADTIKGKGVSFMEGNALWHNNRLTERQYQQALDELKEAEAAR